MSAVMHEPQRVWVRHHPQANGIALELLRHRDILRLRAGRVVADVRSRYSVGITTARIAVALARKAAPDVRGLEEV